MDLKQRIWFAVVVTLFMGLLLGFSFYQGEIIANKIPAGTSCYIPNNQTLGSINGVQQYIGKGICTPEYFSSLDKQNQIITALLFVIAIVTFGKITPAIIMDFKLDCLEYLKTKPL